MTSRYLIEFFNGSESCPSYEEFSGRNAYEAIGRLIVRFPYARVQNVALILDFDDIKE